MCTHNILFVTVLRFGAIDFLNVLNRSDVEEEFENGEEFERFS